MLLLLAALGAAAVTGLASDNQARVKVINAKKQEARGELDEVETGSRPALPGGRHDNPQRTRQSQLAEISGRDNAIETTDEERKLNKYIAAAVVSLSTAIVGLVYPLILPVTVGSAIYATMKIFKDGYKSLAYEHRFDVNVVGSLYFVCAFAMGFFLPAAFGLVAYYLSQKWFLSRKTAHNRA